MTKIAVVIYSTWGHVLTLAKSEVEGLKAVPGVEVDLFQFPSDGESDATSKSDLPVATPEGLEKYDGFLFGVPTRFGQIPAQFKSFFDSTGGQWAKGAYFGKYAGFFVSTGTPGGGQETTVRNTISQLTHHGILFVPLGYATAFGDITNLDEVHGASPWGAGTYAGASGERQPSQLELKIAQIQGESFAKVVAKAFPKSAKGPAGAAGAAAPAASSPPATKSSGTGSGSGSSSGSKAVSDSSSAPEKNTAPASGLAQTESESKSCCGVCTIM